MPLPKLSLILFDWDGFTMITESNRLQDARKKELKKATRSTLSYDGQLHVVEILELSDNRATLEDFDTEWASTHRAEAISDEQAKRQRAKGRTKKGGFLDIWGDPDNQQQAQLPVVHHEEVPSTTKKIKKGSNGRQITVLYEGSADDTDCIAEPRRQPLNMETLSNTEKDVVNMQIQFHDVGHICMGTMTDSVIILEDGELEDMLKTARSKKGTHISTQTNDPTVSAMSTQISLTTETQCTQTNAATEVQYSKTNDPTVSAMSTQTSLTTETQCTQTNAATEVQYSRTNDPTVSAMSTQTSLTTDTQCTQTNAATEVQYSKTNDPTVSAMSTQTSLTTETQCTQTNAATEVQYSKTNDPTVSAMSTQTSLTTETQCTQTNAATEVQYSRTNDPTVSVMSTQTSLTTETQCTQTNAATEVQYSRTNDPTVSAMSTQTSLTTETQCTQTNAATEVQYSKTNDPTVSAMSTQTSLTTETQCTQTNAATEVQYSKTNDPTVSAMSTQTSLTTETQCTQSNCIERILGIEKKLDEILTLMQTFNRPLNVSDIVNWVSANTPNHTGAGVTIVPVTEAQSLPVITPLASCVSPIIESEELPVERDFTDDYPHISALPPLDPPSSPTVRRPLFSSPIEPQENRRPLTELTSHVNNVQSSQTSAISSQKLVELNCSKDDPLKEINDFNDISDGKYEFRIRRETLARLKSSSCSDGNFLLSVTRKILRTDELVGKNFFGRKGRDPLSPRRVHALKHAYVDFCGSDYKAFTTAVCSINNGIRSLNR